jgi:hypothetical protein
MEENTTTEDIQVNSIERYKISLFKLWKQSCEKKTIKIIHSDNVYDITDKIVNLNEKDNYINDLIRNTFHNKVNKIYFDSHTFHNSCYHFNIDKKKLSISKLIVEVSVPRWFSYTTKEKKLFSNKFETKNHTYYIDSKTDEMLNDFFGKECGYKIKIIGKREYANSFELKLGIPLLTYNNIFIPINFDEYEELRCYELECRKKDDMEDVYRHLTLLSPSEYKEFIMWKESQKMYEIKDSKE